jgi:hypothetical protein
MERKFVAPNGRAWIIHPRSYVRKHESDPVTLELVSGAETRIVNCPRAEWEGPNPDLSSLLARAVTPGAGRNVMSPQADLGQ